LIIDSVDILNRHYTRWAKNGASNLNLFV